MAKISFLFLFCDDCYDGAYYIIRSQKGEICIPEPENGMFQKKGSGMKNGKISKRILIIAMTVFLLAGLLIPTAVSVYAEELPMQEQLELTAETVQEETLQEEALQDETVKDEPLQEETSEAVKEGTDETETNENPETADETTNASEEETSSIFQKMETVLQKAPIRSRNVAMSAAEEEETEEQADSVYGKATGKEGTGNSSGNVVFTEYEKDGEYTLVFRVLDKTCSPEDCAITTQFRSTEYASRTTRIVLEEGITGIGWMYLYDRGLYFPRYSYDYIVDRNKTDIFQGFKKLVTVVPCSTLVRIGWSAFNGCEKLSEFDFTFCPNLEEIMNQAFYGCKALNYADLSYCTSLSRIAWSAFNGAGRGKDSTAILPVNLDPTEIGLLAFSGWRYVYWAEETKVKEVTIRYSVEAAPAYAGSLLFTDLPQVDGKAEIKNQSIRNIHTIQNITANYYQTKKPGDGAGFAFYTYEFKGWKTEDGRILDPGAKIEISELDADKNGIAELVSAWSYTWKKGSQSSGTPSVNYSIWTNVSTADSQIDGQTMLNENGVNYTPSIAGAMMHAVDENGGILYSDTLASPSYGGRGKPNVGDLASTLPSSNEGKYAMITYVNSSILEADAKIRQLAENGYYTDDSNSGTVCWKLSSFPTDEEVLTGLAEMVRNGSTVLKDENGTVINDAELNTRNFSVHWCHVKYQSGANDGWHIDGKLTRKACVKTGTFYIETFDHTGEAIGHMGFTVGSNDERLQVAEKNTSADGEEIYQVLFENGESAELKMSRKDGRIVLSLPYRTDGTYGYVITETIPAGYEGAGTTASFRILVDPKGNYTISDIQMPEENGSITAIEKSGNISGAQVINNKFMITTPAPTGVSANYLPFLLILAAGVALGFVLIIRKKRENV